MIGDNFLFLWVINKDQKGNIAIETILEYTEYVLPGLNTTIY